MGPQQPKCVLVLTKRGVVDCSRTYRIFDKYVGSMQYQKSYYINVNLLSSCGLHQCRCSGNVCGIDIGTIID